MTISFMCCPIFSIPWDICLFMSHFWQSWIISLLQAHFILTYKILHNCAFLDLLDIVSSSLPLIFSVPRYCSLVFLAHTRHVLERLGCSLLLECFLLTCQHPSLSHLLLVFFSKVMVKPFLATYSIASVVFQNLIFPFLFFLRSY